jgi:hypothetical protein
VIRRNRASDGGGGIYNVGRLLVTESVIRANRARSGAGIFQGQYATLTLRDSRVVGNAAVYEGGGIVSGPPSEIALVRCVVSRNSARRGGGIALHGEGDQLGSVTLTDSKVLRNTAWGAGEGSGPEGS